MWDLSETGRSTGARLKGQTTSRAARQKGAVNIPKDEPIGHTPWWRTKSPSAAPSELSQRLEDRPAASACSRALTVTGRLELSLEIVRKQ